MFESLFKSKKPLSPEQVRKFEEDGYLVLERVFGNDILDMAVRDFTALYGRDAKEAQVSYIDHIRIQDAWQVSPSIRSISTHPLIMQALEQLHGRKPKPFQTLNFRVGTQQRAHSDTIHFNSVPKNMMAGAWVALEDVTAEQGPLFYVPGSHLWPEIDLCAIGIKGNKVGEHVPDYYAKYEDYIESMIADRGGQRTEFYPKKGDILIWSSNILHGGSRQTNPARTRLSQVTHYYFENCRYYTPLLSNEVAKQYRDPYFFTAAK